MLAETFVEDLSAVSMHHTPARLLVSIVMGCYKKIFFNDKVPLQIR